jgi:hypothetical protein
MIRKIFYHAKKIPGVGTVWQEVVKKAQTLLEQQTRVTLCRQDFAEFQVLRLAMCRTVECTRH